MKVLVVSQYYPPEPVPLPASVAGGLRARGHDVRVLAGVPNYPEGRVYPGAAPRGEVRDVDGVPVRTVPLVTSHSRNPLTRALNYVSFGLSARRAGDWAAEADVVYVYAPQLTAAIGPAAWCRRHGLPYVLHVQDLWPDSITGSGMLGARVGDAVAGALGPWIRSVYARAAAVLAIAPTMSRVLVERGVPADRVVTVPNWDPAEPGSGRAAPPDRPDGGTTVTFAGNVGELQDLETTIAAAARLRDEVPGLVVEIVGSGTAVPRLRALADELGAANVRFVGRVPRDEMDAVYARSDFQLVTLKDLPVFRATIPSKLPAALARGIPVISSVAGDAGGVVRDGDAGLVTAPGDVEGMADALRAAARSTQEQRASWGHAARRTYDASMSQAVGIDTIESALRRAARPGRGKEPTP